MLLIAGVFFVGIVAGAILAKTYPFATESLLRAYAEQIESLGGAESISTAAILRNNLRILLLSPVLAVLTLGLYPLIVATLPGVILGMLAVQIDMFAPLKVLCRPSACSAPRRVRIACHCIWQCPLHAPRVVIVSTCIIPKRHRKRGMGRGKYHQRVCLSLSSPCLFLPPGWR